MPYCSMAGTMSFFCAKKQVPICQDDWTCSYRSCPGQAWDFCRAGCGRKKLTDRQRLVLTRCVVERKMQIEVAEELGTSRANVSDTLNKALKKLRKFYNISDRKFSTNHFSRRRGYVSRKWGNFPYRWHMENWKKSFLYRAFLKTEFFGVSRGRWSTFPGKEVFDMKI